MITRRAELVEPSSVSTVNLSHASALSNSQIVSDISQCHTLHIPTESTSQKYSEEIDQIIDELEYFHFNTHLFDDLLLNFPIKVSYTSYSVHNTEPSGTKSSPNPVHTVAISSSPSNVSHNQHSSTATSFFNTDPSMPESQLHSSTLRTGAFYTYPRTISDSNLNDNTDTPSSQISFKAQWFPSSSENDLTLPYAPLRYRNLTNATCHAEYSHSQYKQTSLPTTPVEDETHNTDYALQRWLNLKDDDDISVEERLLRYQWHNT